MKNLLRPLIVILSILLLNNSCKKTQEPTSVTDFDGNVYKIVTIGTQVWMQENLKTTRLNDGTSIPVVTDNTQWTNLRTAGVCYLNNNETTNKDRYGALYNWYTAKTANLCPDGWHVPSNNEVNTLIEYLGGSSSSWKKLIESGTVHWNVSSNPSTNESEFTALPGGYRNSNGSFSVQDVAYWWTSNENNTISSVSWYTAPGATMQNIVNAKETGLSIRCIKN